MVVVESFDPHHHRLVTEFARVHRLSQHRDIDVAWTEAELRVMLPGSDFISRESFVAFDNDAVIGAASVEFPERDNQQVAYVEIDVLPHERRRGVGTQLLARMVRAAVDRGRSLLLAETTRELDAQTSPGRDFVLARGFEPDTLIAVRSLELSDESGSVQAEPLAGYRFESWTGAPPVELAEDYARLRSQLNEEAPAGEVHLENEYWDVDRLADDAAEMERMGRVMVTVAALDARDVPIGHTQLVIPAGTAEVFQWDTLVLPDHRGHGLGVALKQQAMWCARDHLQDRRRILTWNDAQNAPMIAVNEALGYRQIAWCDQAVLRL